MPATGVNPLWLQVAAVSPGTTVTGGWNAEYFSNRNPSGAPTLTRQDAAINFTWGNGSPDPSLPADSFSACGGPAQHALTWESVGSMSLWMMGPDCGWTASC
jgi:hypothetical protein